MDQYGQAAGATRNIFSTDNRYHVKSRLLSSLHMREAREVKAEGFKGQGEKILIENGDRKSENNATISIPCCRSRIRRSKSRIHKYE